MSNMIVDVIVAGGGTAGGVIAGRLAAADPTLSILVIEAGPPTYEDLAHVQPARYLTHLLPESKTVKLYAGKYSEALGGRTPIVPCGQCLGGGSSVNFAMYARASASDYDDWESIYDNPGWGSRDLLPLLRKTETYQAQEGKPNHGYSGPLGVSYGGQFTNLGQQWLGVATQYDKERTFTDDPNGLYSCNSYGSLTIHRWINARTGRRSDVPHNYLYNQAENKNLKILTSHHVKRIIFEYERNKRAVGIEYIPNISVNQELLPQVHTAHARRLIVVSAGAFGSPAILERSGIGSPSILKKLEIDVKVDLPGVGQNYQDHNVLFTPYLADDNEDTLDSILRGEPAEIEKWSTQWLKDGTGLMAHNGIDAGIKIRPSERELGTIGPEFEKRWASFYANAPDKPVMFLGILAMYVGDHSTVPDRKYFCMDYFLDYPATVGYVHITSADDVNAPPDFDPNFLSSPDDLALLRWGYKHGRELSRRMPSYRGEYPPGHPVFPEGSLAACRADRRPVEINDPDIQYTAKDDKAIDEHIRKVVMTTWHSLGTCAMKQREAGGVVDSHLNVYGVEGLKVADLSIAPSNVGANTYSTALVIGEKAAQIIANELGVDDF
ncbi:GMC oxidoreductase [Wolfiporia cocos MD-104 SS10]|uniref:GMC oxidoreductase n=1 Tax=Wolfiporia cocos (strain MD-104) TaxID=742152 RepID=A0A2H3K3W1_WOLCO|nr:GMC oxidoreductase [Wolfiporia cocos MD-104 SS10]